MEPATLVQLLPAALIGLGALRVAGFFLATPFGPAIPARLKAALAVVLSMGTAAFPSPGLPQVQLLSRPLELVLAACGELCLGFALGLAFGAALRAIETAGRLWSQDMGLDSAAVLDPLDGHLDDSLSRLKAGLGMFVFLALDVHHLLLRLCAGSFRLLPPGGLGQRLLESEGAGRLGEAAVAQGASIFEAAVRLSLPLCAALLCLTIACGILVRFFPEAGLSGAGPGLRVVVGFLALVSLLPFLARAFQALFEKAAADGALLLGALSS